MTDLVQLTREDNVAVITVDNPPVNALAREVREGLLGLLDRVAQDKRISGLVLTGANRTFPAGSDIKEFVKMTMGVPRGAGLLPLILRMEESTKPIVIAIHGTAFGGGLELAMAGHYRVALSTALVGQLEVRLGLVPGAAGTQFLPRLA